MKYLTICLLSLLIIITFCILGMTLISNTVTQMQELIMQAESYHINGKLTQTLETLDMAIELWSSRKNTFGILLYHEKFESILTELEVLHSYAQSEDSDDFLSGTASLLTELSRIQDAEVPNWSNIL